MRTSRAIVLLGGVLGLAFAGGVHGTSEQKASPRVESLAALGSLWSAIDLFHPALATSSVDWDSVFVAAVARVQDGRDVSRTIAAAEVMTKVLGDPATRILRRPPRVDLQLETTDEGFLVVGFNEASPTQRPTVSTVETVRKRIRSAPGVLVVLDAPLVPDSLVQALIAAPSEPPVAWLPKQQVRKYSGFPNEGILGTRSYTQTWRVIGQEPNSTALDSLPPLVFVLRDGAHVPAAAACLQAAGRCGIVSETAAPIGPERTSLVALPGGAIAVVRTAALVGPRIRPDMVLEGRRAIDAGLEWLRSHPTVTPDRSQSTTTPDPGAAALDGRVIPLRERRYGTSAFPDRGYRILAAVRLWRTIDHFFPYKDLMGTDWDAAFRRALPRIEAARDSLEYAIAISELCKVTADSHVRVNGGGADALLGVAAPLVRARIVEGVPIVAQVLEDSLLDRVRVGDEIRAVDGEPAAARIARLERVIPASTPQALRTTVTRHLLAGAPRSVARITLRAANGAEREVRLERLQGDPRSGIGQRTGDVIKRMPGDVGYVDLDRLTSARVQEIYKRLGGTRAIVFDMRGYPRASFMTVAAPLARTAQPVMALFSRPECDSPDAGTNAAFEFEQRLSTSTMGRYEKPTFLLVDERSLSAAEHTGLAFEAANGTQFIGSPTMGANGDVTSLALPGDLTVRFTGQGVRHADGGRLQRVGLVPHVRVEPTLAGIRAGRDEVLERALVVAGGTGAVAPDEDPPVTFVLYPTGLASLPRAWAMRMVVATDYQLGQDTTVAHSGRASGTIRSIVPAPDGSGSLDQNIRAESYAGRRVAIETRMRTRGVRGSAAWFARVMGPTQQLQSANTIADAMAGDHDWTEQRVEVDVPPNSVGITFGVTLQGTGQAWIDDVTVTVVGSIAAANVPAGATTPSSRPSWDATYAPMPREPRDLGFE